MSFISSNNIQPTIQDVAKKSSGFNLADDNIIIQNKSFSSLSLKKHTENKQLKDFTEPAKIDTPYSFSTIFERDANTKAAEAIVDAFARAAYREGIAENIGDADARNPFLKFIKPSTKQIL